MSAAVSTSRTQCLDSAPRVTLGKPDKGSFALWVSACSHGIRQRMYRKAGP